MESTNLVIGQIVRINSASRAFHLYFIPGKLNAITVQALLWTQHPKLKTSRNTFERTNRKPSDVRTSSEWPIKYLHVD